MQDVGPIFHQVFQAALRVGKAVRAQTGMDQGKLSVASVAVDLAREVFDSFADKTVLVIGAGKMGETTLQHLKGLRPGTILVTNRSPERAEAGRVALGRPRRAVRPAGPGADRGRPGHQHHGRQRADRHARAISAGPARRRNRLALILDIAIPRDFDPRIGDLDQVMLYHVDDLRAAGRAEPSGAAEGDRPGAGDHRARDGRLLRHAAAPARRGPPAPGAGRLVRRRPRQRELNKLFAALPHLSEADREAIAHMMMRAPEPVPAPPARGGPLGRRRAAPRPPPPDPRRRPPPLRPGRPGAELAQEDLRVCMSGPAWTSLESRLQAAPGHPDRLKPGLRRKTGMIR